MISIHWEQHPVGHGGFHIGKLEASDGTNFSWAFDCGSRRTARFNEYLEHRLARSRSALDWLFISHFDTDHVSGLDELMLGTDVRNVMVPYLENHEIVLLMLHEIDRGTFNRSIVEMAADSAAYFLSRGASRVIFLGGGGRTADPDDASLPPDRPEDGRGWSFKMKPPAQSSSAPSWTARPEGMSPVEIVDDNSCDMEFSSPLGGLRLKPYRVPITEAAHTDLVAAIENLVGAKVSGSRRSGLGKLAYAVAHHARTQKGRAELRKLYADHAGSSNRSSLSLLSVPIVADDSKAEWHFNHRDRNQCGTGVVSWMNTGDAELLAKLDLEDWKSCYAADLAHVAALALPHHGSDKNSGEPLQALCPIASLLAHVSAKRGKHPGANVTLAADERLCCVTEHFDTAANMYFSCP